MVIDESLLKELLAEAAKSPRLRMNRDMRNSPDDRSQRMLNALLPGTQLPIHRHQKSSETVIILYGKLKEIYYNERGEVTEEHLLAPASPCVGLCVPKGQWHTIEVIEPSVISEMKEGSYEPLTAEDTLELPVR